MPVLLPEEHHDGFLTTKVQKFLYPDGQVVKTFPDGEELWVLRWNSEKSSIGLGPNFKAARESINSMIRAKRASEYMEKHKSDYPK